MCLKRNKIIAYRPILLEVEPPIKAPKIPPTGKAATTRLLMAFTKAPEGVPVRLSETRMIKSLMSWPGALMTPV